MRQCSSTPSTSSAPSTCAPPRWRPTAPAFSRPNFCRRCFPRASWPSRRRSASTRTRRGSAFRAPCSPWRPSRRMIRRSPSSSIFTTRSPVRPCAGTRPTSRRSAGCPAWPRAGSRRFVSARRRAEATRSRCAPPRSRPRTAASTSSTAPKCGFPTPQRRSSSSSSRPSTLRRSTRASPPSSCVAAPLGSKSEKRRTKWAFARPPPASSSSTMSSSMPRTGSAPKVMATRSQWPR
mmetsp:Transcript_19916/g.52976  ORF Transcript_19916/g.52976 Transcript_19916/m.52976 type:complete len:235 (-) Transcript_19916:504-1208(-)